jgi:hypothetical protein
MREHEHSGRSQRGAALIVGLVMLAIITLLAITAMNTSSTELIMAGNEQFRERAFQASEAGLEQAARDLALVGQDKTKPKEVPNVAMVLQTEDKFTTKSNYVGVDDDIPGFSSNQFAGFHYRVESTGVSRRNSSELHMMGAYVLAGGSGSTTDPLPGAGTP